MARGAIGAISRTWCFLHSGAKIWSFACTDFAQKSAVTMKYKMRWRGRTGIARTRRHSIVRSTNEYNTITLMAPLYPRCSLCVVQITIKNRWQFSWYIQHLHIRLRWRVVFHAIDRLSFRRVYGISYVSLSLSLSLSLSNDDFPPCNITRIWITLHYYLIILSHYMRDNF